MLVKAMNVVSIFLIGEYTRVMSAMRMSLVSLLLQFPKEPSLSPNLSGWNVGMQNQIFCSSPAALHLMQNCLDLAFMQYIGEVGDRLEANRSTAGVPKSWLFSEKLSDELCNRMNLLLSWTPSLP